MKKFSPNRKRAFALSLALFLCTGTSFAFDFYKNCSTGQRLYYNIIDASNHYVEITYPGTINNWWEGFDKPTGNITFPSSVDYNGVTYTVTQIGVDAFYGCSDLTGSLTIPNSVTSIGACAFYGCAGFTGSLTIGNSVTTIGASAFYGCAGFTGSLTIPNSVTSIELSAFHFCSGLTGSLTLPDSMTTIEGFAFYQCSGFTGSLTIPNSVTSIGLYAFAGCHGFDGMLTIGSSVTSIGSCAFYGCSGFVGNLTIPNSVTLIEDWAFGDCVGFTGSLIIPNSVTTIGKYAFWGCSGFTGSLTIGNSVTSIGESAFRDCTGFTGSLTIGNSVTSIGESAFSYCSGFTGSLTIPNSVTTLDGWAFQSCSGFTGTLTLSNSITTIGTCTFDLCSGFTGSLVIPNSVTTIGRSAFDGCSGFTGSLIIPNSVTEIGSFAFGYSGFTGSLTIGNSVTTIGDNAFAGCEGLSSATIPSSVTEIGDYAFFWCTGLTSLTVLPDTPPTMGYDVFKSVRPGITVYVPCSALEDYQAATGWSYFTNIQCITETVTVYDGTASNNRIPAYIFYFDDFTRSQFVIPAADLAEMTGRPIYSMTFYTTSLGVPYTTVSDADVYLMEVDYTSIDDFEPKASATIVYSGRFEIVTTDNGGEMTIDFSTPYTYNGGNLLVGIENTQDIGYKNIRFFGRTVDGASISGSNGGSLANVPAEQQNFIPKTTFRFSPVCPEPSDLTVTNITSNSADLHWNGNQESYNVRYRTIPDGAWVVETVEQTEGFADGFENGLGNWTLIDADGDGYNWRLYSGYLINGASPHGGVDMALSQSWVYNMALYPDNYLVTPRLTLGKTLTFWASAVDLNYAADHFGIAVSTSGNTNPDDFTLIQEWTMTAKGNRHDGARVTRTQGTWYQYAVDLSAYAGQTGYIAIRHFSCSDQYVISVDDFSYGDETPGITLMGLNPGATYEVQVQGICAYGLTEWSETATFTTLGLATVTQTVALSAGINWFSTNVEITLDDLKAALLEALPNTSITIKGKSGSIKYIVRTHSWNGTLDWDVTKMYKIEVPSACEITLEGAPINPAEHPVTISPNTANWIGYPLAGSMTVTAAFADFGVVTGDVVKSKSGSTRYRNGSWRPNGLTTLEPGQGYIFNSAATGNRTLVFPSGAK